MKLILIMLLLSMLIVSGCNQEDNYKIVSGKSGENCIVLYEPNTTKKTCKTLNVTCEYESEKGYLRCLDKFEEQGVALIE